MGDEFTEGHYVLGIEGLALLRAGADRRTDGVDARVDELREVRERLHEAPYDRRRVLPAADAAAGYGGWADSYDDQPGNDTIAAEQPVVWELLDALPDGPVLDAACGTGRHTAHLLAAGREVIGVDSSPEMLERARVNVPGADLREGRLEALPVADGSMAGAVCGLALAHLPRLEGAVEHALTGVPAVVVWEAAKPAA